MKLAFFTAIALFLTTACEKQENNNLNKEIDFYTTEPVRFGQELELEVLQINDSRCPVNVQCVWEGYVAVTFQPRTPNQEGPDFGLCLGSCNAIGSSSKELSYNGVTYKITLLKVEEGKDNKTKAVVTVIRVE